MSIPKQVIVMRTDTNPPMRKGKMIAQGAHASNMCLINLIKNNENASDVVSQWMNGSFAKICVRVDSLEELNDIYNKAYIAGLEVHMITDNGKTEFKEPTITCLAIGPDYHENIDPITKHLKLL
jgi:PTH2 family peptidyl-tRNA hydrolase